MTSTQIPHGGTETGMYVKYSMYEYLYLFLSKTGLAKKKTRLLSSDSDLRMGDYFLWSFFPHFSPFFPIFPPFFPIFPHFFLFFPIFPIFSIFLFSFKCFFLPILLNFTSIDQLNTQLFNLHQQRLECRQSRAPHLSRHPVAIINNTDVINCH
ncbi:uncharacterized protein YALI1_C22260g [Yarrowia lipolytica]|uniref:Uncharacterized protein n=1 Tax=Yarrowia lipolytica TaxID=4952 RepID=A0A1D8NBC1_YARLL|nr:hypothetical protein YALI1_C22260g [Yarrowia lipolytica]